MKGLQAFRPPRHAARSAGVAVLVALAGIVAFVGAQAPPAPPAPPLPLPSQIVPQIDLKCYKVVSDGQGLNINLSLQHLNPVLQRLGLPDEFGFVGPLEQLCVPVAKDGVIPPPNVLSFIQYMDLACYTLRVDAPAPNLPIWLSHLNPVLQSLGMLDEHVVILDPRQLCVPVAKNGDFPLGRFRRVAEFLDLKCYDIVEIDGGAPPAFPLQLTHLNPVLQRLGLPDEHVMLERAEQLCVPVAKDGLLPPPDVLEIIQWIDLKKYRIVESVTTPLPTLTIDHLNPLLVDHPRETVTLIGPQHLAVPVAKNGHIPTP